MTLALVVGSITQTFLTPHFARTARQLATYVIPLLVLGLTACCDDTPQPLGSEELDEKTAQTRAHISFSYPQVFSRESLINDRLKEGRFLEDLLTKSADVQFQPQLRRDISAISSLTAELGISFNPALKSGGGQSTAVDQIKQEIELTRLRAELRRVQQQFESLQRGVGEGPSAPTNPTPAQAASQTIDQSAAKAQLASLLTGAKTALDKLDALTSRTLRQAGDTQAPEDRFKDLQAYRSELRSALNVARLDDVHDRDGNALYRLQFLVTVFPGAHTTKRQWGIGRVEVMEPPVLQKQDVERLYLRWLTHSTVRLNKVVAMGKDVRIRLDRQYDHLINDNSNIAGLSLQPTLYGASLIDGTKSGGTDQACNVNAKGTARKGVREPLLIATNPDHLDDIKWLLLDCNYKRVAKMVERLISGRFGAQATRRFGETLRNVIETHKQDESCEFFRDSRFAQPDTYREEAQKTPPREEQAQENARTIEEIFDRANAIALARPFLIAGVQAAEAIEANYMRLARRKYTRQQFEDRSGITLLRDAVEVAADWLWVVEGLYGEIEKGCQNELQALRRQMQSAEVPCSFVSAILETDDSFRKRCGMVAALDEGASLVRSTAPSPAKVTATDTGLGDYSALRSPSDFRDAEPSRLFPAKGKAVVYSVSPTERAQRLSSVASAANSAQMALGISAGFSGVGAGTQAGLGHLQSAAGNADAVERLPLVVAFSEQAPAPAHAAVASRTRRHSRFGWVFGPRSYIRAHSGGDPTIGLRHMTSVHEVAVEISVPVWWPRIPLSINTAWVSNVWDQADDVLDSRDPNKHNTQVLGVNRPISEGDLDTLTAYILSAFPPHGIRLVQIDRVEPSRISLCGEDVGAVTLLIYGVNLWRNPEAYFLGQRATKVHVLPDMQGLAVDFSWTRAQARVAIGSSSLVVWTQSGRAEFPVEVQVAGVNCPRETTGNPARAASSAKAPVSLKD